MGLIVGDGLWLRLMDLPRALEARAYEGSGALTLEVTDTFVPANTGRWRVEVTQGEAVVTPDHRRARPQPRHRRPRRRLPRRVHVHRPRPRGPRTGVPRRRDPRRRSPVRDPRAGVVLDDVLRRIDEALMLTRGRRDRTA